MIVLESLETPPLASIDSVQGKVFEGLESQGVGRDEIDVLLVDYEGYRCFGVPVRLAANARILVERRAIRGVSLSSMMAGEAPAGLGQPEAAHIEDHKT